MKGGHHDVDCLGVRSKGGGSGGSDGTAFGASALGDCRGEARGEVLGEADDELTVTISPKPKSSCGLSGFSTEIGWSLGRSFFPFFFFVMVHRFDQRLIRSFWWCMYVIAFAFCQLVGVSLET